MRSVSHRAEARWYDEGMPRRMPWKDEFTLLCERCGYVLEGIATDRCPECGKPVVESRPEARAGTEWQRGPGFGTWFKVNWGVVWRPRGVFRAVSMGETRRAWGLLLINVLVGVIFCGGLWVWVNRGPHVNFESYYIREVGSPGMASVTGQPKVWTGVGPRVFTLPDTRLLAVVSVAILPCLLVSLTKIEALGVRFFGRQRGWRVTKTIAWNVCCHASIGWTVGCLLHALTPLGLIWGGKLLDLLPANTAIAVAVQYARWSPVVALFVGMLIFETLVYMGVRECRFANRARPGAAAGGEQADERANDNGDSPPH